jgi:hypothetical protein
MVLAIDGKNWLEVASFSISGFHLSIFIFDCGRFELMAACYPAVRHRER